jgi:hypothetical protein
MGELVRVMRALFKNRAAAKFDYKALNPVLFISTGRLEA